MSTLTADRIRDHATRLGLSHLTDTITELVERAETGQMGYLDFVDLIMKPPLTPIIGQTHPCSLPSGQ